MTSFRVERKLPPIQGYDRGQPGDHHPRPGTRTTEMIEHPRYCLFEGLVQWRTEASSDAGRLRDGDRLGGLDDNRGPTEPEIAQRQDAVQPCELADLEGPIARRGISAGRDQQPQIVVVPQRPR